MRTYHKNAKCGDCGGPLDSHRDAICLDCCSEEQEDQIFAGAIGDDEVDEYCPTCGGSGEVPDNGTNFGECEDCDGTGIL